MIRTGQFDVEVATAAVAVIASRVPNVTVHTVCKLLYFAEKMHLERYGRQFLKDTFVALDYGPVPSRTYDLIKSARGEGRHHQISEGDAALFSDRVEVRGSAVSVRREPDLEDLSVSAIKCLNDTIQRYGGWDFDALTEESHDKAWHTTRERWINGPMSLEDIARTLPDASLLVPHLTRG